MLSLAISSGLGLFGAVLQDESMRFVAFSDTHGFHDEIILPEGDVLLFAGDICGWSSGTNEIESFGSYLAKQPHPHKIVIAGNHDWAFQRDRDKAVDALGDVHYLQDEEVVIKGIKIYGSPWQPEFYDWAFNLPRGPELAKVWAKIPIDTQVLLTHGPPRGILDQTTDKRGVGCEDLRERLADLKSLRAHVFGHIHEAYGCDTTGLTTFYNVSVCDRGQTKALNRPWVFEL